MSRRERLEARAERRREWAAKRDVKVSAVAREAEKYHGDVAFNTQPGHIPARARLIARQERAFGDAKMAEHHRGAAAGIEHQLARSIFSDDPNAPESLEAKAASIEADADRWKALGAAWRKRKEAKPADRLRAMFDAGTITEAEAKQAARDYALQPYHRTPWPSYHLTNLRANARRCRERAKAIRAEEARKAEAEAAPGGVLIVRCGHDDAHASITFPDYPGRETVAALKAAGFWWNRPSWHGEAAKIPACVLAMVPHACERDMDGFCTDPACPESCEVREEGGQP